MGSERHNFAHNIILPFFHFMANLDPIQPEDLSLSLSVWGLSVRKTSHIFSLNVVSSQVQSCKESARLPEGIFGQYLPPQWILGVTHEDGALPESLSSCTCLHLFLFLFREICCFCYFFTNNHLFLNLIHCT